MYTIAERISEISRRVMAADEAWLDMHDIDVSVKARHFMLNYRQFGDSNTFNVLCRGTVLSRESGQLLSLPFERFFNVGQSHAAKVDFANSDLLEKLDGCMLCVFFENDQRVWHTRGMISADPRDMKLESKAFVGGETSCILQAAERYLDAMRGIPPSNDATYIFEMVDPSTRVITNYQPEQCGLYLTGIRWLSTFEESSESVLDLTSRWTGLWKRPRRWSATSLEAARLLMQDHPPDFEGYVVRDRLTGARVKLKSQSYLDRHHCIGKTSIKRLVRLWLAGERAELEAYFPELASEFDRIGAAWLRACDGLTYLVHCWQRQHLSRRDLAQAIVGKLPPLDCAAIFACVGSEDVPAAVQEFLNRLPDEKLMGILQLEDKLCGAIAA